MRILFETAKLAKEKGFDIICDAAYCEEGVLRTCNPDFNLRGYHNKGTSCLAPTQSQLQTWLRNEWDIQVNVIREYDYWTSILIFISRENLEEQLPSISKSYETALEIGLEYALKHLNSVS